MRLKEINSNELEIKQSDIMLVFIFGGFAILGVAILLSPIFNASEWWFSLVGLAVIAVCVSVALFFPKNRHAILRKGSTSDVSERRIITKKVTASTSFNTADIVGVGLDTNTSYERDSESDGSTTTREVRKSRLYVTLQNGSQIVIGTAKSSGPNMGKSGFSIGASRMVNTAPLSAEANQIAQFLGVPLNGNTVGQKIDGIVGAAVETITSGLFGGNQPTVEQSQATPQNTPVAPQPVQQIVPPAASPPEQQTPPTQTPPTQPQA